MMDLTVDEAKEIIGRDIYGEAWVTEITDEEWNLAQQYKKGLTRAATAEEAHAKLKRAERQGGAVGEWLEDRAFNTTKQYLDRKRFEAARRPKQALTPLPPPRVKARTPGDADLVRKGLEALATGAATSEFAAAKLVCGRQTPFQTIDRIRKLLAKHRQPSPET